jgi:hypothetical protein
MSIGAASYSPNQFVFVASHDFLAPRVRTYAVPRGDTRVVMNSTRIANTIRIENHVVVNSGPDVSFVQRASGRRVVPERIESVPNVAPRGHMSRDDLRVDAAGSRVRLRAAEPVYSKRSENIAQNQARHDSPRDHAQRQPDAHGQQREEQVQREHDRERPSHNERPAARPQAAPPQPQAAPQPHHGHGPSPAADPRSQPPHADNHHAGPPAPAAKPGPRPNNKKDKPKPHSSDEKPDHQ